MATHNRYAHPEATHRTARRTLIACEGRATETGYFEALRRHLRLPPAVMSVFANKGSSPLTLVRQLVAERDRRAEQGTFDAAGGDVCWVVCDGDEHRLADAKSWNAAIALAEQERVRLAISNPSFELWYLLHYQDQFAPLTAAQALAQLKRHLPRYAKASVLFPEPLLPRTAEALRRAKTLDARARAGDAEPFANPSTGVAVLVAALLGLA